MSESFSSVKAVLMGKKILLAEDMQLNQFLIRQLLSEYHVDLHMAANGLEAVEKCKEHIYDLIILDIRMPRMGGVEACREIRKLTTANSQAPIVALTAHMFEEEQLNFFSSGMNAAVLKPVEKDSFVTLLYRLLQAPQSAETFSLLPALSSDLQIDLRYLRTIGNNSVSFITLMLDSFLQNAYQLQQQLAMAVDAADLQAIGAIAHQLKFSLGVLGIKSLDEKLNWLEVQSQAIQQKDVQWFLERSKRLQSKLQIICEQAQQLQQQQDQLLSGNT